MTRGRKPGPKKAEIRFDAPEALVAEINLILLDPFTNRIRYGELGKIGTKLFQDWVQQIKENGYNA